MVFTLVLRLILLTYWYVATMITKAVVLPSSIENVCPGERVSVVCNIPSNTMIWIVPDPTRETGTLDVGFSRFLHESIVGQARSIAGDTMGVYQVTLNSLIPNLTSTLEVTLYSSMDGQDIQCSGLIVPIHLQGPPTTPSNFHIIATSNNSLNSTVTFGWEYSVPTNQVAGVVNFSIWIYDSNNNTIAATSRTHADFHLSYNTNYTVMVKSVNCAGSSSSSLLSFTLVRCNEIVSSPMNGVLHFNSRVEGGTVTLCCDVDDTCHTVLTCSQDAIWEPDPQSLHCNETPSDSITTLKNNQETTLRTESEATAASEFQLSFGEIVGMSTATAFALATVIGFLAGLLVIYLVTQRKKAVYSPAEGQANISPTEPAGPVYEEISPVPKDHIELKTNQAYGP